MGKQIIAQMPDNWAKVFGSEAARKKRFRAAMKKQAAKASEPIPRKALAGVTDDQLYNSQFDHGSGRRHKGYADYKEFLARKGWVCTG